MNNDLPLGTVVGFALSASNIPADWLPCDGSSIPSQYGDLITALGSNNTPDLRGRTLVGAGAPSNGAQSDGTVPNFSASTNFVLQTTGGEYLHNLIGAELPSHTHALANGMDSEDGSNNDFATPPAATNEPTYDNTVPVTGHNTMQPFYVVNYIIYAGDTGTKAHKVHAR
jgi:microcystin-dependent protein